MAVCYRRLLHLLVDKEMTSSELAKKAGITLNVIARLKRNEYVSLESIEKICVALDCGVDEILEFTVPDKGHAK